MGGSSRFVWHDFYAADLAAAKRFYGELFGWTFKAGDHGYEHIAAGGQEIGGMLKLEPQMGGAPPHWVGYVAIDDLDRALAAVTGGGGKTFVKEAIPNVGEFAVCADAQGAVFSPFHPARAGRPESNERPAPYTFCWDELLTSDPDGAARFYASVFGWGLEHADMPGFGRYTLYKRTGVKDAMGADKNAGGMMKLPPGVPRPFWLTYVAVENAEQSVDKAKRLGATVTTPPMDIPEVGRFATMLDAQHAPFAVLAPPSR